jgi:HEAT repeat protein
MAWQGVEIEIEVPCAGGQKHPVRLRFTGWGEFEVVHNPCEELLGSVFARMAACTHYLHEQFPEAFRNDTDLKRRLVEAFGAAGAPAVPALIKALGDDEFWVRRAAAWALGAIGDPQAVPPLSVWAHAGEDAARDALQTLGHPMLDLPQAVAQVAAQGAWGVLIRALTCTQVREVVVGLGAPAVPALIQALGDSGWNVRRAAVEALGAIGDPKAIPALIKALRDDRYDVHRAARQAIQQIQTKQSQTKRP